MENSAIFKEMLTLQGTMNAKIDPAWKTANYKYSDAIMVEAVEAFDHTNWKWWKDVTKEPNWEQIKLEIIDIWHFSLSLIIRDFDNATGAMPIHDQLGHLWESMSIEKDHVLNEDRLRENLRQITKAASSGSSIECILGTMVLTAIAGMDLKAVFDLYVPKNVLNIFRQDNGYKTGEYFKDWNTVPGGQAKEDNVVLMEIINCAKFMDSVTSEYLFTKLNEHYDEVKAFHATNRI